MANYAKRVSVFSSSGADPVLKLSDEAFCKLEEIYGHSLSEAARDQLIAHAEGYFHWRIAELNSDSFGDVRRLFEQVKEAVAGFQRLAFGELVPMTDAGATLEGVLADHMRKFPISVRENQLWLLDPNDDSNEWQPADAGGTGLTLMLDSDFLTNIGISLSCVIAKAEEDIAAQEADGANRGFVPGNAFPRWLLVMRGWAIEHGLRYGPLTAEGFPSRFSRFLFEVNGRFATDVQGEEWKLKNLKEPVASVEALAERLRKVSRAASAAGTKKPIGVKARA